MTATLILKRKAPAPGTYTMKIVNGKITRVLDKEPDVPVAKQPDPVAKQDNATKIPTAEVVRWMIATYPLCFFKGSRKPLKIGIREDLIAAAGGIYGRGKIKEALTQYTRGLKYQQALVDQKERVDLEGKAVGVVTSGARDFARFNLKKFKSMKQSKG